MVISSHLVLLLLFAAGLTDAIRVLKDGAIVDAEGREYKTAAVRSDAENISRPQSSGGSTVHIQCTEVSMIIVVNADLYGKGRRVSAGDLFLGGTEHSRRSECRAVELTDTEYVIEAKLQNCGSTLSVSEDSVIYSNKLIISPAASYYGITRTAHAEIPVSCHYKRAHLVSSQQQQQKQPQQQQQWPQQQQQQQQSPALSTSAQYSTQQSAFSLKLMTDDWTSEKLTHVFYFGDLLHIEASYTSPVARQRRLFVDSCVATLTPDPTSDPTYYFVENHGCVTDAKEEGSNALFKPRKRASSLQLQLDAILFHNDSRNTIFITCQLKAVSIWKSSPINKACNYKHSRWESVDGRVGVCQCCNSICHQRSVQDMTVTGTVTLGPLMIFPSK